MKFLLDANMPRSAGHLLRELGHEAQDVRDILPHRAADSAVAEYAETEQLTLITRDFDFADLRNYPPRRYPGIIVLELPDDAAAAQIKEVLKSFASQPTLLAKVPGRLAIVEPWRVRFRPHVPKI